ncbi:MAG TPA: aminotransferase class I/II-fold pyridoxal phosphate-dependent enzyme [Thermomicrobiaceae bacterium]|nr:aminotransferase class I/II-fold pyridoxal phosphate-dependent enzyme [Thermomicrobiaceae bacterium]
MPFEPSHAVQRILAQSQRPGSPPGAGIIRLVSGDPDFATPEYIRRALIDAIEAGYTHYADGQGDPELRAALAEQASRGADVTPTQVVVTHGGSGALASALLATVNPGDRILLPEPTYSAYADVAVMAGAEPVFVPQTADFHLDLDALEAAAGGARLVVLCHPCNPTGVVYRLDELQALGELAERHDLLVLSDEAYDHIVYDGVAFTSTLAVPALRDRLIYCQTFSKTYAMTGWRLGYLIAPPDVAAAASRIHRSLVGPLNSATQRAALAAVTTPSDWPERMRREYQERRELVVQLLADVPGVSMVPPEGAFYAFIHYDAPVSSRQVAALAREHGVAIRSGSEYGPSGEGYVRVAFSSSRADITEGLMRLRSLLAGLDGQG